MFVDFILIQLSEIDLIKEKTIKNWLDHTQRILFHVNTMFSPCKHHVSVL